MLQKVFIDISAGEQQQEAISPYHRWKDIEHTEADFHLVARPEESRSFNGSWPKNDRSFTFVDFPMGDTYCVHLRE